MTLFTNLFASELSSENARSGRLIKIAATAAIATLTVMGIDAARSPALSANPADVARLIETGACKACDLTNANLTGKHLIGVDLREADLTGAVLAHANLEGADLTGATLVNTDFTSAFLTNALLDNTVISNTDFSDSTLYYTSMDDAQVDSVTLIGADILSTPISVGGGYDQ